MKKQVLAVVAGIAVASMSMWPATAAPPKAEKADATLSPSSKKHEWTGGPYVEAWPGNAFNDDLGPGSQCGLPDSAGESPFSICDYTFLDIQPGPNGLSVQFDLTHAPQDDFDFYVYDPEGKELVSAGAGTPVVDPTEKARLRFLKPGIYTVEVVHFLSVAGTYSMSARVA